MNKLPTVFIDIDNTLIVPKTTLSKENFTAINNYVQSGGEIVFATGKMYISMIEHIQNLNISDRYHIASNGALVFNYDQDEYLKGYQVQEEAKEVMDYCDKNGIFYFVSTKDKIFYTDINYDGSHDLDFTLIGEAQPEYSTYIDYKEIVKLIFIADINDVVFENTLKEGLKPYMINTRIIRTASYLLELHNINQTKYEGAKKYCELHSIDLNDCYAIGDSENDLPLLQNVGHPYIVENAADKLKNYNFKVLPSCKDNGVAYILNQLLAR